MSGPVPKIQLSDGETRTHTKSYTMKRIGSSYYCTCSGWKACGGGVHRRTCKHLKELLGEEYEEWRVAKKGGTKRKVEEEEGEEEAEEEEEEEEEEKEKENKVVRGKGKGRAAKAVVAVRKGKKARISVSDEDDEDEEQAEEDAEEEDNDGATDGQAAPASKKRVSTRPTRAAAAAAAAAASKPPPSSSSSSTAPFQPLLAHKWDLDGSVDVTGWHCSEKLDGVRAYWTGTRFQSREGNPFFAPAWFTKRMPKDITLDGELFTTRGGFQDCVSIVRAHNQPNRWKFSVTYQVFDCPSKGHLPFEQRLAFLKDLIDVKLRIKWVNLVSHQTIKNNDQVFELLEKVTSEGGEGLMLRQPASKYINGRSRTLLKVKKFFDADAFVRGYNKGSGKNSDVVGALVCEMVDDKGNPTGRTFKCGSGLTDQERKKPPKIGSKIIYRYQELSKSGNPRFPTFVGVRAD